MHIRVTCDGEFVLDDPENFERFSIIIEESQGAVKGTALQRIARLEGKQHAWVKPDVLRSISPRSGDLNWEAQLERMIDFAAGKGWIDGDGAIRAHVEGVKAVPAEAGNAMIDVQQFKDAMRNLAGGVALVTSERQGKRSGMTVSAVTAVSTEPPSVLVCVNKSASSHDVILESETFGVSMLASSHHNLARRFAGGDGVGGAERFEGFDWDVGRTGAPLLRDALCSLDCELLMNQSVGSHTIFIGAVVATSIGEGDPLVNFRGRLTSVGKG